MSDTPDIKALIALCRYLVKRSDELEAQIEAALLLLQHHEVFSEDEYSQMLAQVRADILASRRKVVAKAADAAQYESIRRLLESFEGPEQ